MKKSMLAAVVAFSMVCGVYAAEEAKADAKKCPVADAKKAAASCEACAKLAKDAKAGEQAKPCDACAKKCGAKSAAKAE